MNKLNKFYLFLIFNIICLSNNIILAKSVDRFVAQTVNQLNSGEFYKDLNVAEFNKNIEAKIFQDCVFPGCGLFIEHKKACALKIIILNYCDQLLNAILTDNIKDIKQANLLKSEVSIILREQLENSIESTRNKSKIFSDSTTVERINEVIQNFLGPYNNIEIKILDLCFNIIDSTEESQENLLDQILPEIIINNKEVVAGETCLTANLPVNNPEVNINNTKNILELPVNFKENLNDAIKTTQDSFKSLLEYITDISSAEENNKEISNPMLN